MLAIGLVDFQDGGDNTEAERALVDPLDACLWGRVGVGRGWP